MSELANSKGVVVPVEVLRVLLAASHAQVKEWTEAIWRGREDGGAADIVPALVELGEAVYIAGGAVGDADSLPIDKMLEAYRQGAKS